MYVTEHWPAVLSTWHVVEENWPGLSDENVTVPDGLNPPVTWNVTVTGLPTAIVDGENMIFGVGVACDTVSNSLSGLCKLFESPA